MFKVGSLIILVASLIWTWSLLNSPSKMNTQIHAEIQSKLAILIEETIKAKRPQSSDFEMNQMYTSAIKENLVSAYFSYKFKDPVKSEDDNAESVEQSVTGYAVLEKVPSDNTSIQKWVIQSIKTNQKTISFAEGTTVTADGKDTPDESAPPENK